MKVVIKCYEEIKRGEVVAYQNNSEPPTIEWVDGTPYIVTIQPARGDMQ